jgi:prephenate dehydrogenase
MARVPFDSIAVVGFGLIGASLALAVKNRAPGVRVVAIDQAGVIATPIVQQIADHCVLVSDASQVHSEIAKCELTVLATPVTVIEEQLAEVLTHAQLVTDCGSTKRAIVHRAQQLARFEHFVPGHPMAGRPRGGAESAEADLFQDRNWILCPGTAAPDAFERVRELVEFVGGTSVEMEPDTHDLAVAVTSHVPQLFASLLAVMVSEAHAERAAGPGFQSATRVAGGNITMWRDIFSSNADAIARVTRDLAERLSRISAELADGQVHEAMAVLERARDLRRS